MYTFWTKGLTEKEEQEFKHLVSASSRVLDKLIDVVKDQDLKVTESRLKREKYDSPCWPYFQADCVGEQRAYKKILQLLENLRGTND